MEIIEKPNILLVDDRPENLEALVSLLEEFDANLIEASSGNQALEIALRQKLALVLMDVQMPEMDGFETATLMRCRNQFPIIFVTAYSSAPQNVFQGYQSGAVDYLQKPIDPLILKSKVQVFLSLYEQKQRLETMNVQLRESQERLEEKVEIRTSELREANTILQQEMAERKRAEEEQQSLEKQLRQAQKIRALGTLAGGVAHQFNNLLVPILGFTKKVHTTLPPESKESEYLKRSIKAANRAKELITQVMIFSHQTHRKHEPLLLTNILKKESSQFQSSLPGFIFVKETIADPIPLIKGDASQIQQLIGHLLANARDAMPDGGEVIITLNLEELHDVINFQGHPLSGAYLCLKIEDPGQGMEEATLERMFEPFFTTKEEGKGMGLGLSIVLGIVEQHEGDIQVKSQPGAGTTVSIYLPVLAERMEETDSTLSEVSVQ